MNALPFDASLTASLSAGVPDDQLTEVQTFFRTVRLLDDVELTLWQAPVANKVAHYMDRFSSWSESVFGVKL